MVRLLGILSLLFFATSTFGQDYLVDSLAVQLRNHPREDTTRVKLLNELSYQYQWFNFYHALQYADEALVLAKQLSYKKGIAVAKNRIAHCNWELGDSELAIEQALQAATIAEKEGLTSILAESFRILAINYRDQKDYEKAGLYINKAEKLAFQIENWDLLSRVYNFAGVIQFSKKNIDTALVLYKRALSITETHTTSNFQLSQIYSNIGEIYGNQPDTNPALEHEFFRKALAIAKETRNRSAEAAILNNLGKVMMKKKRYTEADEYFHASLDLARELSLKRVIKNVYLSLVDLNVRKGKSVEANAYMEHYYDLRDSLLNEKKTRQIVELEARFEAEKKEQMILFLEQESRMQAFSKNIWIVGSVFLLIFGVTIYYLQQQRSRKTKQLLEKQRELNSKLQETDQLKTRFFTNISHEFRTPLSLIIAPLEARLASPSNPNCDKSELYLVKRNAERLLDLINQMLDLSKLDAGKMNLRIQQSNLEDFLNIISASFDSLAENKGIHFTRSISVPQTNTWFDADKLEKIINNILFNAIKFTPRGGAVILSIHSGSDGQDLRVKITDTGKGIPEGDLVHVFTPFYQSKNNADDTNTGTGLGLSLVNELVRLYNGEIEISSQVDKGTTITISLPVVRERLPNAEEVQATVYHPAPKREQLKFVGYRDIHVNTENRDDADLDSILIVEDNADLRNFVASGFRDHFRIYTAKDGEEGLQLAIEHIPNLIISDVMMPRMDGIEMTERIRADERTSHIPVILLTAKADGESRKDGFRTGADDYIAKPFSKDELHIRAVNLIELRKKLAAKFRATMAAVPVSNVDMPEPSLDEKFLRQLKSVIHAHISDATFGVEDLAAEMCLSRTQLFRKVKALLQISPSELINDIRLQKAASMIKAKSDTLAQIGYAVGFNEQSYFAKRFRKKFGVSPSKYNDN